MITELRETAVGAQHKRLGCTIHVLVSPPQESLSLSPFPPFLFRLRLTMSLSISFLLPLWRNLGCTPLRACFGRGPTTREILFYPLTRSNSLGFTGGGDTRHTRGTCFTRIGAHTVCSGDEGSGILSTTIARVLKQTSLYQSPLSLSPSLAVLRFPPNIFFTIFYVYVLER